MQWALLNATAYEFTLLVLFFIVGFKKIHCTFIELHLYVYYLYLSCYFSIHIFNSSPTDGHLSCFQHFVENQLRAA